jgi:hypothetical protein
MLSFNNFRQLKRVVADQLQDSDAFVAHGALTEDTNLDWRRRRQQHTLDNRDLPFAGAAEPPMML